MKQLIVIMKGLKTLFFSSIVPIYRELGHAPSERSTNRILGRLYLSSARFKGVSECDVDHGQFPGIKLGKCACGTFALLLPADFNLRIPSVDAAL